MRWSVVLVFAVATNADRHHHRLLDDGFNVVTHECFFTLNDTIALDAAEIGSQKVTVVLRRPVNIHLCPVSIAEVHAVCRIVIAQKYQLVEQTCFRP